MTMKRVLVTGGAGFIGSHLVDALLEAGHHVRVFDNLESQVHPAGKTPDYLNKDCEFIRGDIRDKDSLGKSLEGIEWIVHYAAAVGVGQSQYQVHKYVDVNIGGTANLLDLVVNKKNILEKIVVAGSMSGYGEGCYNCSNCSVVRPEVRSKVSPTQDQWDPSCPECGGRVDSLPTPETALFKADHIYAITKKAQEEMVLSIGRTYGIPAVSLRYFNVYGSRQALTNPYTGVVAIFLSRLLAGNPPVIYEDGNQTRDFIAVQDVARATILALGNEKANGKFFNVGTGVPLRIADVARALARLLPVEIEPRITRSFRKGDIRHCYADISEIKTRLGFVARHSFEDGMRPLIEWARETQVDDRFDQAAKELKEKGLVS